LRFSPVACDPVLEDFVQGWIFRTSVTSSAHTCRKLSGPLLRRIFRVEDKVECELTAAEKEHHDETEDIDSYW
jgi:hypothetical protein